MTDGAERIERPRELEPPALLQQIETFEHVKTIRFYATVHYPSTQKSYRTYGYIVKNDGVKGVYDLVPLLPLSKRVQHGMSVTDTSNDRLIQLDSQSCAQVAASYAERILLRRVKENVRTTFREDLAIDQETLRDIIRPPITKEAELKDQRRALNRAGGVLAYWDRLTVAYFLQELIAAGLWPDDYPSHWQDELLLEKTNRQLSAFVSENMSLGVEEMESSANAHLSDEAARVRLRELIGLKRSVEHLGSFLNLHLTSFHPLVILNQSLQPKGHHGDSKAYAFITHEVKDHPREVIFLEGNSGKKAGRHEPAENRGGRQGKSFPRLFLQFFGFYRFHVDFPLNPRAESSHFRIALGDGARILYGRLRPKAQGLTREDFEDPNFQERWHAKEEFSYTFYRRKDVVTEWAQKVQSHLPPHHPPSLVVRVWAFEQWTSLILSSVMLIFAGVSAFDIIWPDTALHGPPYLTASLVAAIPLAVFSHDKPLLRQAIITRIAIAVAIVLFAITYVVI